MDENTFWIKVWTLISTTVALTLMTLLLVASQNKKAFLETISKSPDPIAVACAVSIKESTTASDVSVLCSDKARK